MWNNYTTGPLFSNKKESKIDTCCNMDKPWKHMLSEKNKSQKVTYCMIPSICQEQANPQRQKTGVEKAEGENGEWQVSFWSDKNKLDYGDVAQYVNILKSTELY